MGMRVCTGLLTICVAAALWLPSGAAQAESTPMEQLDSAIREGNCQRVGDLLNAHLRDGNRELLILAGVLFEDGICLKPSWPRAEDLYQRAAAQGHTQAALRLVAGYASAQAGPDVGASLWWSSRTGLGALAGCPLPAQSGGAEAFVEELKSWHSAELARCVYLTAVMARIRAELFFPPRAGRIAEEGVVHLIFRPALGEFTGKIEGNVGRGFSASWTIDGEQPRFRSVLLAHVREVSLAAIRRFPRPANLPDDLAVQMDLVFRLVK